jgi:hypothetical protein
MIWPWQRYRVTDEIIACACGSTLPALPQVPLANMVRRGARIIRVNTGSMLQCVQCQQRYYVATEGPHKGLIRLPVPHVNTSSMLSTSDPTKAIIEEADEMARRMGKRAMPIYSRDEMRDPP